MNKNIVLFALIALPLAAADAGEQQSMVRRALHSAAAWFGAGAQAADVSLSDQELFNMAVRAGDLNALRVLIGRSEVDVNIASIVRGNDRQTALSYAAGSPYHSGGSGIQNGKVKPELVEFLLGCNDIGVSCVTQEETPAISLAIHGRQDLAEKLLQHENCDVSVEHQSMYDNVLYYGEHESSVENLLRYISCTAPHLLNKSREEDGETFLTVVVNPGFGNLFMGFFIPTYVPEEREYLTKLLMRYGANPWEENSDEQTAFDCTEDDAIKALMRANKPLQSLRRREVGIRPGSVRPGLGMLATGRRRVSRRSADIAAPCLPGEGGKAEQVD